MPCRSNVRDDLLQIIGDLPAELLLSFSELLKHLLRSALLPGVEFGEL